MNAVNVVLVCLFFMLLAGCNKSDAPDHGLSVDQGSEENVDSANFESLNSDAAAISARAEVADSYATWRQAAGFDRPLDYDRLAIQELEEKASNGDRFASQKLGEIAWGAHGDRETATTWLTKSAEQGSVAALGQIAMMFDPESDAMMVMRQRGTEIEGSHADAYMWSRLAVLRGDPDAAFGAQKHANHLSAMQLAELEIIAMEEYQLLQKAHVEQYGRGFVNSFPVDPNAPHNQLIELTKLREGG